MLTENPIGLKKPFNTSVNNYHLNKGSLLNYFTYGTKDSNIKLLKIGYKIDEAGHFTLDLKVGGAE